MGPPGPEPKHTVTGEREHGLSGGQRQRIALARTMLRRSLDPDPRRGHQRRGHRHLGRGPDPQGHRRVLPGPHDLSHLAQLGHDPVRRPHRPDGRRLHRRLRHPPRAETLLSTLPPPARDPLPPRNGLSGLRWVAGDQWPVKARKGDVGGWRVARTKSGVIGWAASPSAPSSIPAPKIKKTRLTGCRSRYNVGQLSARPNGLVGAPEISKQDCRMAIASRLSTVCISVAAEGFAKSRWLGLASRSGRWRKDPQNGRVHHFLS